MRLAALLVVACLSTASCASFARQALSPDPEQIRERLRQADANGDGAIDRSEAQALPRLAKGFDRLDTDADGVLSRNELDAAAQKARQRYRGSR